MAEPVPGATQPTERAHGIAECDRLLRADRAFAPSFCRPAEWTCDCGRKFEHVCDEAEGCFWEPE